MKSATSSLSRLMPFTTTRASFASSPVSQSRSGAWTESSVSTLSGPERERSSRSITSSFDSIDLLGGAIRLHLLELRLELVDLALELDQRVLRARDVRDQLQVDDATRAPACRGSVAAEQGCELADVGLPLLFANRK